METKIYPIKCSSAIVTEEAVEAFRKRLPLYGELIKPGEYRSWWEETKPSCEAHMHRISTVKMDNVSHIIESVELEGGSLTAGIRLIKPIEGELVFGLRGFSNHLLLHGTNVLSVTQIITFDLLTE